MTHLTLVKPQPKPRPSFQEVCQRFAEIHERMLKDVREYQLTTNKG